MFKINYDNLVNSKCLKRNKIEKVSNKIDSFIENNQYSLFDNIDDNSVEDIIQTAKTVKKDFSDLVVVGIGGSILGTKALLDALEDKPKKNIHILDNVDPDLVSKIFKDIDISKTCFNIVSKSGNTIEILSLLKIIAKKLKSVKNFSKQIVITTTNTENYLTEFAKKYDVKVLYMPNDIVGRFSSLTAVGLFPCAFCGYDIKSILKGSKKILSTLKNDVDTNDVLLFSFLQYQMLKKKKYDLVILPYVNKLENLFVYYAQTLAESLGKCDACPSSSVMVGANCQHSFFEQIFEGRDYRYTMLVKLKKFNNDIKLDNKYLCSFNCQNLSEILNAECEATLKTLKSRNKKAFMMEIEELNEEVVGELFTFIQMTICVTGILLDIDAFSQPAVEVLKKNIHSMIDL